MAKKKQEEIKYQETIIENSLEEIMSQGFGRYSKYVLQERAVPDVRDGLKPVQRRIIYTMYLENNVSTKPTRKCARTVGAVIGRFHPHGDTSVYEAMVRLSQDWKMRVPLIDFQGNNGSIDGDGPAAYRYTEARLSEICDQMILDLNKDTVDMELNFDDQELEPVVLPSRFPNLLVNGSQGIAMGAATDIPPHNLEEVIDATIYRINHKKATTSDLMQFIKGPDFPTGGIILNTDELKDIYEKGKGLIKLLARTSTRESKDCNQIVISEIPFGVNKSELVSSIDRFRFQNSLTSIIEVRDETDKDGLAIVIDVKKDADIDNLLKFIISKGVLTQSIKFNMLVIDHNRPRTLSLLEVIDCYIMHQKDVITRRSQYDLKRYKLRLHIVEGLIKAISMLDKVISLIRSSKDKADAKNNLIKECEFTEAQADALLNLQLYRLSNTDVTTLIKEAEDLRNKIASLEEILNSENVLNRLICKDLQEIKNKFKDARRTTFQSEDLNLDIDKRALITKEDTVVVFTRDGYFKRCQMRSYLSSNGQTPGIKDGDCIKGIVKCTTLDYILAFTNLGNYLFIPIYRLFDNKWKEEGKHINEIGSLSGDEKIIKGLAVSTFKEGINIVMISKLGQIKRSPLKEFEVSRFSKPIKCFKLNGDDTLVDVCFTTGNNNLFIVNSLGQASLFNENEITLVSLRAGGVKALASSKEKSYVVGMISYLNNETSKVVLLTNNHAARIIDEKNIVKTARLGMKTSLYKTFKSDPQECVFIYKLNKDVKNIKFTALLKNNSPINIEFTDLKPSNFDSYLKKNLNFDMPFPIYDVYNEYVPLIDDSIEIVKVYQKPINVKPEKKEVEQLSLFEYIDDDD